MKKVVEIVAAVVRVICDDAEVLLEGMSQEVVHVARQLSLPAVPDVFISQTHLTCGEWRVVAEALQIVALFLSPYCRRTRELKLIVELLNATSAWYWSGCIDAFLLSDIDALQRTTTALRKTLLRVQEDFDVSIGCPKVHRMTHVAASVEDYGPYDMLTAEMGEASHQRFKHMFATYV